MRLLRALGLFLALLHVTSCLRIGAFNIQCFGDRKSQDNVVMNIIKEIVLRYDIILIQEVRCNHNLSVPNRLLALVNEGSPQFKGIVSEPLPLGSTISHRERYLFLYRYQNVAVTGWFQYDEDTAGDFMRPPFVVKFSSTQTAVEEFVLIPIHTKPGKAVEELRALVDVVKRAETKWLNKNIMVLGDFNAGSNYVPMYTRPTIPLFNTTVFHWLIADNVDTTVSRSGNAYDRIVVTTDMYNGMNPRSADKFDFKNAYGLTQAQTEAVSDHFPVEVQIL